ncbi:MAG: efflux RND transporter periplasmic adaptor subunit [Sphingobacterium sp.]|uniref:efflux RND transporter periplasmic adaptor subunit n=1 Tax=Sphingobacterium sp. JB170 TaxID=1434842 RepID=UPI00097EBCA2|nr:efflux RND transporter periplasmic adaptor subunit [Sphingobacterium sp. JB170]SJN37693.1 Probable Co/Zn/Cd efflux system membrane fusion protein [Sphingobacterium sp. JB170]
MKRLIITVLIVAAALAGIFYILDRNKTKNEEQTAVVAIENSSVAVRVDSAGIRKVNAQYVTNGVFAPKQEVILAAEAAGKVTRVLVDEGAFVRAGQTLAIVDGDKQNVNVANMKATYENAKAEVDRFENAYSTGGVTKQQLDQVKLQLENASNNLKTAQISAGDVNVSASFAGIVNRRSIEPGSYVSPGTEMFEIVNVSTLKLMVNVDEKNIGFLSLGQTVRVESAVLSDREFNGVITFIAPKADGGLNFPVELEINNNSNNDLRAGMYGSAYFGSDREIKAMVVPRSAFVGSVSSNNIFVVVDGKAILKTVVSGRSFGDDVEIVSGVQENEVVITSGQINLVDGTPVKIIK